MKQLIERIREEGENAGGGIIKVDGFLNHQVDTGLTQKMGERFVEMFLAKGVHGITKVITAEVSGIPSALITAQLLDVPMIYARKHRSAVMTDDYFVAEARSRTKGEDVRLMISKKYLSLMDRVLIIDDFLATGSTITALCQAVGQSGAIVGGIGCVIEKPSEGGREKLEPLAIPIATLARVVFNGERLAVEAGI